MPREAIERMRIKKLGIKVSEKAKKMISEKLKGRKQSIVHIKNSLNARGFTKDLFMMTAEQRNEYRYFHILKVKFDMPREKYEKMLKEQNNVCKLCKNSEKRRLALDHCHTSNKIRGLLCGPCNRALGLIKDNQETLKNMINYLKHYENN